jgi:hypothetical protein
MRATAPTNNFYPQKREEKKKKKKREKKKNIAFTLGGWIGLSRFFGRILPEVQRGVEIVPKTRRA